MENWSLSKIILTIGALAIIAGASFLISSAGNKPTILERPPEVIENIDPNEDPFKGEEANQPGGIVVVPTSIVVKDAISGIEIPEIVVRNNSQTNQTLNVDFVPVTRQLAAGGAVIPNRPEDIAQGKRLVRLSTNKIFLRPGQARSVKAKLIGNPSGNILIGSITFAIRDATSLNLPESKNVQPEVKNLLQISSMVYFLFGKQTSDKVSIKSLVARSKDPNNPELGVEFFSVIQSENDSLSTPKGVVTVRNRSGEVVQSAAFAGDQNVFPRQKREIFTNDAFKLRPGQYQVEARVISGNSGQAIKKPLEITSNGSPVDINAGVFVATERIRTLPGSDFPIDVEVLNSGNKDFTPKGTVSVYPLGSDTPIAKQDIDFDPVKPDDAVIAEATLKAPQKQGIYSVVADVVDEQDKFLSQASADMVVAKDGIIEKSLSVKIRDWLSDNPFRAIAAGVLGFGLFSILIIGAIALFGKIKRRKK